MKRANSVRKPRADVGIGPYEICANVPVPSHTGAGFALPPSLFMVSLLLAAIVHRFAARRTAPGEGFYFLIIFHEFSP